MRNTSEGYHTFAFFQRAKDEEYSLLENDFIGYMKDTGEIKRCPIKDKKNPKRIVGWEFTYKTNKGIRWLLLSNVTKNGYSIKGVLVVINPKVLIEGNYIAAAQADDLKAVEELFNHAAKRISSLLLKFGLCSLNRVDPCINIDLEELRFPCTPEQMMILMRQGNVPKHYRERKNCYDKRLHRKMPDKNSFYLENKSVVINYYWKYPKQNERHPNFLFREDSRHVIRLEVECKYPKLYALSKNIRQESKFYLSDDDISSEELYERVLNDVRNPSIPIDVMLSDEMTDDVIRKYYYRIIRKGDYFTLEIARNIVESYHFRRDKEERMIYALEFVNESRGIAKAKHKLLGPDLDEFKRSLKDLDDILVNPVTIPRSWNIKHIPNLLRAYDDSAYEKQLIPLEEFTARKQIDKLLSE